MQETGQIGLVMANTDVRVPRPLQFTGDGALMERCQMALAEAALLTHFAPSIGGTQIRSFVFHKLRKRY